MKLLIPSHTDEPFDSDDDGSSIHGGMVEDFNLPISSEDEFDAGAIMIENNLSGDDVVFNMHPSDSDYKVDDDDLSDSSEEGDGKNKCNGAKSTKAPKRTPEEMDSDSESLGDSDTESEDENDDDDDVNMSELFSTRPNIEANRNHPPNIITDSPVVDVCFHPHADRIVTANMDGECIIYKYTAETTEELKRLSHHQDSIRHLGFSDDGSLLYTVSKDKSFAVIDSETYAVKSHIKKAHESPLYSFFPVDNNICATGDDDGLLKLWDLRSSKSIFEFRCGEQTVSAMVADSDNKFLCAAVLDGSLTGINLKNRRLEAQSEMFDSEFVSLSLIKNDTKLCVGTSLGLIYIFKWGDFGFNMDAMKGHPQQVTSMAAITDNTILTGCEDGCIRAVHIFPHRFDGVIGQHADDLGIENLSVSQDGHLVASCAMEETVHFWNIEYLYKRNVVKYNKSGNLKAQVKKHASRNLESSRKRGKGDFFYDLNHAPEEEDDTLGPVAGTSYDPDKD